MSTKTAPGLSTLETILGEVDEYCERVRKIRVKMARARKGSEAYLDLLSALWVELDVLQRKAEWAARTIDEYQESLPDED